MNNQPNEEMIQDVQWMYGKYSEQFHAGSNDAGLVAKTMAVLAGTLKNDEDSKSRMYQAPQQFAELELIAIDMKRRGLG